MITGAADGMFAFFCITAIENQDTNAQVFNFDRSKMFVNGDPDSFPGTSFDFFVQTTPATLVVPAHSTSSAVGRFVINVGGGATNPTAQMYNLVYMSSGGESVLLERDGGNNPPPVQFLDPASPVHPDNLPACP